MRKPLAVNSVIRNIDMHSKNWYIYRDTGRSGEWAMLPWDLDLSYGRIWTTQDTYFDNALYTDGFVVNSIGSGWWPKCSRTLPCAR
jgi:spore coat protein CotH